MPQVSANAAGSGKKSSRARTHLNWMRFVVIAQSILVVTALLVALYWGTLQYNHQKVSFDYKPVTVSEYSEKNGVSVFSYEESENRLTLMMSEDLMNTLAHKALAEIGDKLEGHQVYEFVYRQQEDKFHLQMQSSLLRVPVVANAGARFDAETREVVLMFDDARMGETNNFWARNLESPSIHELRIPEALFELPEWLSLQGIQLSTNELLLYLTPDLDHVSAWMTAHLKPHETYLSWESIMENPPVLTGSLADVQEGRTFSRSDAGTFLALAIDDQAGAVPVLSLLEDESIQFVLDAYPAYWVGETVNMQAVNDYREILHDMALDKMGSELLLRYARYVADGIGVEPDPYEVNVSGTDSSYVAFADRSVLTGTMIVIQGEPEEKIAPQGACFADRGTIYDYHRHAFITAEFIGLDPSAMPEVEPLKDFRLYYDQENRKPAVLYLCPDGQVREFTLKGTRATAQMITAETASMWYPYWKEVPEEAFIPEMDDEERAQIIAVLEENLEEGEIYTRFLKRSSDTAFTVFSTKGRPDRVRTALLHKESSGWAVMEYDVCYYLATAYEHPEINGTVFPLETILNLTVRTIPEEGLSLLLEKAIQTNLATKDQTVDYYYYIGNYIYARFSGGRHCIFQVDDFGGILAVRSIQSAAINWDLPSFFRMEEWLQWSYCQAPSARRICPVT